MRDNGRLFKLVYEMEKEIEEYAYLMRNHGNHYQLRKYLSKKHDELCNDNKFFWDYMINAGLKQEYEDYKEKKKFLPENLIEELKKSMEEDLKGFKSITCEFESEE